MAGKSAINDNFAPGPPATRYNASGKNREFYTFDNAPGLGAYATGGTIIDGGDGYIYHIFTGTGTFAVNRPTAAIDSVEYLIVAGGGAALFPNPISVGGGGAGGLRFGSTPVSQISYPISIGAGGVPGLGAPPTAPGTPRNGNPSTAFGFVARGGGGGGGPPAGAGGPGGSGGGGGPSNGSAGPSFPANIPREGYDGGSGGVPGFNICGGGGGAGGRGVNGTAGTGGAGGPGRIAPEFPSTIVRRAISAPLLPSWEPLVGPNGYAAGGNGGPVIAAPKSAPANSGYGGQNSAGGSGIVCVRYKKSVPYSRATGGIIEPSTDPEHPGVFRHIFTSPGDFEVTDPTLQYIDYLAVAGGGGGGGHFGGGGGGGGFVSSIHTSPTTPLTIPEAYPWNPGYSVLVGEQYPVGVGTYPVVIGAGGAGGSGPGSPGTQGGPTTIGTGPLQINANGGGFGGGGTTPTPTNVTGGPGGSGGGTGRAGPLSPVPTVTGIATPPPSIQGNLGGRTGPATGANGAPGGGAGLAGGTTASGVGDGWFSVLSPSAYGTPGPLTPTAQYRYFAGGGGGGRGVAPAPTTGGLGGAGGGGAGGSVGVSTGTSSSTTNTGGGGGGGANHPTYSIGGSGGPGIVIIQYPE